MGFQWSFGFDIRFVNSWLAGSECQIHSTGDGSTPGHKVMMQIWILLPYQICHERNRLQHEPN